MRLITYSKFVAFIVTTAAVVIVGASIWFRNHTSDVRKEFRQASKTNSTPTSQQSTRTHALLVSRPLYGEASLSEEERRILYKPFDGMVIRGEGDFGTMIPDARKTMPRAYRVGMICLKHRLNWSEVQSLITGKASASRNLSVPGYWFHLPVAAPGVSLYFEFDQNRNLKQVSIPDTWYQFPRLEDVTPDTSIEPPPKPINWGN